MRSIPKAASIICCFFIFSVAWYLAAPPVLYLISVLILPLLEEIVKVSSYKQVKWDKSACLLLVLLFVVLESAFKIRFAQVAFDVPGFNKLLLYAIILSPAAFHLFNLAVAMWLKRNGSNTTKVLIVCSCLHYGYNVFRALVPMRMYPVYILDTIILVIVALVLIRHQTGSHSERKRRDERHAA